MYKLLILSLLAAGLCGCDDPGGTDGNPTAVDIHYPNGKIITCQSMYVSGHIAWFNDCTDGQTHHIYAYWSTK